MLQRVANMIAPIVIGAILVKGSFASTVAFISMFLLTNFVASVFFLEAEGQQLT